MLQLLPSHCVCLSPVPCAENLTSSPSSWLITSCPSVRPDESGTAHYSDLPSALCDNVSGEEHPALLLDWGQLSTCKSHYSNITRRILHHLFYRHCWLCAAKNSLNRHQTPLLLRGWRLGIRLGCAWFSLFHVFIFSLCFLNSCIVVCTNWGRVETEGLDFGQASEIVLHHPSDCVNQWNRHYVMPACNQSWEVGSGHNTTCKHITRPICQKP